MLQILIAAAGISLATGIIHDPASGWVEGAVLCVIVTCVVLMASLTNYFKDKQFAEQASEAHNSQVIVIRDSKEVEVGLKDLVVGDMMYLYSGERIEVDALYVEGFGMTVDEKELSGIKVPVKKGTENNFILAGSYILDGSGLVLVCCVGKNSNIGKIKLSLPKDLEQETPLAQKLKLAVMNMTKVGICFATVLFLVLSVYLVVDVVASGPDDLTSRILDHLILSITLLCISVPEGLPIASTLSISHTIMLLKAQNCFVRSVSACETLGSFSYLCLDKTGFLTKNRMKVARSHLFEDKGKFSESVSRNTTAIFDGELRGNQTDCALLRQVANWGYDFHNFRDSKKERARVPLSVEQNKTMVIYEEDSKMKIYMKGAPSLILSRCSYVRNAFGEIQSLTTQEKQNLLSGPLRQYSDEKLRILAFSYKEVEFEASNAEFHWGEEYEGLHKDMVLEGFLGLEDPLHENIALAVQRIQRQGIGIILVSGETKENAINTAIETQVIDSSFLFQNCILSSEDLKSQTQGLDLGNLNSLNDLTSVHQVALANPEAFKRVEANLKVIFEATPEDKLLIIKGLQHLGNVVATTGVKSSDCINLKFSDLGFTLNSGMLLTKESSDIIILEENLFTIENSIKYGRSLVETIRRFMKFQLIMTGTCLLVASVGTVSTWDMPLTAIQLLVITIILDSVAAIVYVFEPQVTEVTEPLKYESRLLPIEAWTVGALQCAYQVGVLLFLLWGLPSVTDVSPGWDRTKFSKDPTLHYTIIFCALGFMSIFNMINCRKIYTKEINILKNVLQNKVFIWMWLGCLVFLVGIIEFAGSVIQTEKLGMEEYGVCLCLGLGSNLTEVASKSVLSLFAKETPTKEERPLLST